MDPAKDRNKIIGGSEIAAVMGLSRWATPMSVWAEKTGVVERQDISGLEHVEIGTELESYVAQRFARKSGVAVNQQDLEVVHDEYPYMAAHLDYRTVADGYPVECKTASAWKLSEWDASEIPQEYLLQVMWQLGLSKQPRGWIVVLIGGQKFLYKQVEFNQTLFDKMVAAAKSFWEDYVLTGTMPVATTGDRDLLNQMFPEASDNIRILSGDEETEFNSLVDERLGGKEQLRLVEEEIERVENRIKQILGESSVAETGQYKVTWKNQARTAVDTEGLKTDGLYEKYSKTTQLRVLRTTSKKEKS